MNNKFQILAMFSRSYDKGIKNNSVHLINSLFLSQTPINKIINAYKKN